MPADTRSKNLAIWRFVALPLLFLTVALLGGLRVGVEKSEFIFVAPPLVCLILASLLVFLLLRGRLVILGEWISGDLPVLTNVANAVVLLTLFAASAAIFNSVLPERGLLFWLFALFFLWTLWNNLFAEFDAKRLLRSLAVLFGTAFLLKHLILAAFAVSPAADKTFLQKLSGLILESFGVPQIADVVGASGFAPATGYISFFAVALYIIGLVGLLPRFVGNDSAASAIDKISRDIAKLSPHEQTVVRQKLFGEQPAAITLVSSEELAKLIESSR